MIPSYNEFSNLAMDGLVTMKVQEVAGFPYTMFTDKRRVTFSELGYSNNTIRESRGIVFDDKQNVVQIPPKKVFGPELENIDLNRMVIVNRKINGFMLAITRYNGTLFFSTNGSLTSHLVDIGKQSFFDNVANAEVVSWDYSYIFEVCDPSQQNVISEPHAIQLVAVRCKHTGNLLPPATVQWIAEEMWTHSPVYDVKPYGSVLEDLRSCMHEGYMVSDVNTYEHLVNLKSPYYLTKMAHMSLCNGHIDGMFRNPESFMRRIDPDLYGVVQWIVANFSAHFWSLMNDLGRKSIISEYFYGTT